MLAKIKRLMIAHGYCKRGRTLIERKSRIPQRPFVVFSMSYLTASFYLRSFEVEATSYIWGDLLWNMTLLSKIIEPTTLSRRKKYSRNRVV